MSSSDSQGISSSDACASEESSTSSSSTGSSLSSFENRSGPNATVPGPRPVNQMSGQVSQERDEPVDDEPAPYDPDGESYEGWVNRLEAAGYFPLPTIYPSDIFPHVSKIAQNKRLEAHNRELQDLTARQLDEMANLSAVAGRANAEVLQLKEENSLLMGEVSHLKEEAWVKEQELPGRARQWMEENLVEAARVLTSSEERTMEGFKLLYREEQGKEMITQIGSYGFMSGQKRDREATHAILADRDPDFNAESYGLAPIPDEEPAPPFPLEYSSRLRPVKLFWKTSNSFPRECPVYL
ncbi:unnamed protein product [Cuscuta campestris]|uniref:Uncharacterized protein n=1 Tax=Cuscuta campestris TaxID=132261 RepID=A0A484LL45_9ASTE|nr:unnamed protein product [Cuscuta campestris]